MLPRGSGNHLHFEIRKFGQPKTPSDFFFSGRDFLIIGEKLRSRSSQ